MRRLIIAASARRDIGDALSHSARRFGTEQRQRYRRLIEDALHQLLDQPEHPASRPRDEIRPGIRTLHIARSGRPARHLIVYRIASNGDLQVLRVLHDAMDLARAVRSPDRS